MRRLNMTERGSYCERNRRREFKSCQKNAGLERNGRPAEALTTQTQAGCGCRGKFAGLINRSIFKPCRYVDSK